MPEWFQIQVISEGEPAPTTELPARDKETLPETRWENILSRVGLTETAMKG